MVKPLDPPEFTASALREILDYDSSTGVFRWKAPRRRVAVGSVAGARDDRGYIRITIDRRGFRAHRLAWLYVYGSWPDEDIDHINGQRSDNRIANLRACSNAENGQNRGLSTNNRSGFTGVSYHQLTRKWQAHIHGEGKRHRLGEYDTAEQAAQAYAEAKARFHTFNPIVRVA